MLQPHPLAEIFPPMADEAFAALVADIRENGLREAIIVHDGLILDGRNRYRACTEVGVEPITREWDQRGTLLSFVVSKNLHRRHLSEAQRAIVAGKIATLGHGGERRGENFKTPIGTLKKDIPNQEDTAKLLNVSKRSVQRARAVLNHGTPELQQAVEAGKVSVWAASEIAKQPKEKQQEIVMRGDQAIVDEAHKIRLDRRAKPYGATPQSIRGHIWGGLRDALIGITGLPQPSDVAAIVRACDRTGLVAERLRKAINYLEELDRECERNRNQTAA